MVYNCPVYSYCTHAYRLHFKHKWDISDTSYSSKLALLISANHLHSEHDSNRGALSSISRSCWLSMHLPYRGQMLGKRGGLAVRIFPEGWVLSQDCHMQTPISPCPQQEYMGGYVGGGWYAGCCAQVWVLASLGHVNSPPISYRAPGIGGGAYHW